MEGTSYKKHRGRGSGWPVSANRMARGGLAEPVFHGRCYVDWREAQGGRTGVPPAPVMPVSQRVAEGPMLDGS